MRSKLLFLIMLIAALTALPGTVQANMVVNEGYELDEDTSGYPDDWAEWSAAVSTGGDGATTYREAEGVARTGDDCMQASGSDFSFSYQDFEPDTYTIGQDYTVSAYFKDIHPGGSTGQVRIIIEYRDIPRSAGDHKISIPEYTTPIPNDGNWHLVQFTSTIPDDTVLVTIGIGKATGGAGSYLFDDVWYDNYPLMGVSSPNPADNAKVIPTSAGAFQLSWNNSDPCTMDVFWNNGAADVNETNFTGHPNVVQIGTAQS